MDDVAEFAKVILVVCGGLSLALGIRVVAGRLAIPTAGLLLVVAAVASDAIDRLATILDVRGRAADRDARSDRDPVRGRAEDRLPPLPPLCVPHPLARRRRHLRHGGAPRRRGSRALRPLLDGLRPDRRGARPHRPGRHVLRPRRQGGRGPLGDDPRGRVGLQRSGRHRVDDRNGRARDQRPWLVRLARGRGVPRRDGCRPRRGGRRRPRDRRGDPLRSASGQNALPPRGDHRRGRRLRARRRPPRIRVPRRLRGGNPRGRPALSRAARGAGVQRRPGRPR